MDMSFVHQIAPGGHHTTWTVKFVLNLLMSTLFLSIKQSTTPWNCHCQEQKCRKSVNIKFGVVNPLFFYKIVDKTKFKTNLTVLVVSYVCGHQKHRRLRCLLRVKGLVICFYLGWSGSIPQFRKNIIKSWLLTCSGTITLS